MQTCNQVRSIHVIPDPEDPRCRRDRLGNFDSSNGFFAKLFTRTPNAAIFYSLCPEGNGPSTFLPYDPTLGVPVPRTPIPDTEVLTVRYELYAYAVCPGMQNSEMLHRTFTINRKPYCRTHIQPLQNAYGLTVPDAWLLHDYDNDVMLLYNGSKAALLFDTGFYAKGGDLYGLVREKIGSDKLLYVVHSHNGPDHIQMTWQFVDKPNTQIYINNRDRYMLDAHVRQMLALPDSAETTAYLNRFIHNVSDGDRFDLGNRVFRTFAVPGHTFGHIALLDEVNGDFLIGDCIGSSSILSPASLWMWNIVPRVPINDLLSILHIFVNRIRPLNVRHVYTGHYMRAFDKDHLYTYLDNLMLCAEKLIDLGLPQSQIGRTFPPFAYVPQISEGHVLTNPWAAGIVTSTDLMFEPEYLDGNDERNCDLCYLDVRTHPEGENLLLTQNSGLGISINFLYHEDVVPAPSETLQRSRTRIEHPVFHIKLAAGTEVLYIAPYTNSHFSTVYLGGERVDSTYMTSVLLSSCPGNEIQIRCVSEDGTCSRDYTVQFTVEA